MSYPIVTFACAEGGFVAEIPALPGCLAQGETIDAALRELDTITALWRETAARYGQELPDPATAIDRHD